MKKTMILAASALALIATAACSKSAATGQVNKEGDRDELYTGILPAADCDGVLYNLALDYDDDSGNTAGDFDLYETYLVTDTTAVSGIKDGRTFRMEGDFRVEQKGDTKYIKLIPKPEDSIGDADNTMLYFAIDSPEKVTLVNAELQRAENPALNYTLTLVK